jgi:ribonuclease HI
MGVPQGSVVAPILFSIMLHDIELEVGKPGLFISLFADDLAVWLDCNSLSKKGRQLWLKKYQAVINTIQNYMKSNGFELSPEKTSLMVFTRNFRSRKYFYITLCNQKIEYSVTTKFLGVVIHQNLSWDPHIQHLVSKARKGVSVIKLLCGVTWVTPKSLIHLTQALVRSRLCYGHEATFTKTENQWLTLERIELRAIKAALGVSSYAVNDLVYQNIGWLPLRDQCEILTAKFQVRALLSPNKVQSVLSKDFSSNEDSHRQRLLVDKPQIHRLTTPISSYTKDLFDPSAFLLADSMSSASNFPYWRYKNATYDTSYCEKYAKGQNPHIISSLAKEKINTQYSDYLKYYTDGSKLESGDTGCAFVVPDLHVHEMYKLNHGASIFSAELYAIYRACRHINSLTTIPKRIVILSDSKSVLDALARGGTKTRHSLQCNVLNLINSILSKDIELNFMWIPSHSGIHGNDLADNVAKNAALKGIDTNIGLFYTEISNQFLTKARNKRKIYLKKRCQDHGWVFLTGFRNHLPNLPRIYQRVINRIRVLSAACRFKSFLCPCGTPVSLQHCIDCIALPHMASVRNLKGLPERQVKF